MHVDYVMNVIEVLRTLRNSFCVHDRCKCKLCIVDLAPRVVALEPRIADLAAKSTIA